MFSEDYLIWLLMETYIDYVWIDFTKREVKYKDSDGHEETITYNFDESGADLFTLAVTMIQEGVEPNRRHYKL
ncbi:MAG: hypothetical protein CM15mV15_1570 [uncultured marine virus]|nr:MAG: hypothetical protein CM15mV15_1570 [uncultured marine virus]|tara:strand:+ start:319 stop:537 length:219 start_codon:yes stop_codon:yes gene_type:complete